MIRFIYNLLFPLGFLLFLPGYLRKMRRRGDYRANLGQRFGVYSAELRERLAAGRQTWMHAVSVGEVAVGLKLAAKLRELDREFRCVLTTTTTTGFAFAEKEAKEWMTVLYNPLDFWPIMRRAFEVIRPERIVLVEAEVWLNLVAEAHGRRIPIALVNARLSNRSERRFRRFRSLVRPTFRLLDLVCVQEGRDSSRWEALGVRARAIRQVGSVKYDPSAAPIEAGIPREVLASLGIAELRPILLGGSTHPGEEEILGRAFVRLRAAVPGSFLIIAPRHVERAAEVVATLSQLGLRVQRRSAIDNTRSEPADCLLIDTTGELRHWYAVATVVFMGKSLTVTGGQNPVEPILAGKPVVFGPHMENFATLAQSLVDREAAIQISTADALAPAVERLMAGPDRRAQLVRRAHEVLNTHRGATQRTAELLLAQS